ncbi:MAG: nitrile hydratase subunit beta [Pseudomonadota bacterium]
MNGPQDVGGSHGFGPVVPDSDDMAFHADWEREAFALTILMGATGLWSLDRSRAARERLSHVEYYSLSYYGIWLTALERLLAEEGLTGGNGVKPPPPKRVLAKSAVRAVMARGGPTERPGPTPRFAVGDSVRVRTMNPAGHTRAPRYVRGARGRVAAFHRCHVLPDTSAQGEGEVPSPLYNVVFDAAELWGPDTTASEVHVDLFEPYLEPALDR